MKYILTIGLVILSMQASADYYDGNGLLNLANDESVSAQLMYRGYVAGVSDSFNGKNFCVPKNVRLNQSAEIVLNYIQADPKRWHLAGKNLIIYALIDAFPCKE